MKFLAIVSAALLPALAMAGVAEDEHTTTTCTSTMTLTKTVTLSRPVTYHPSSFNSTFPAPTRSASKIPKPSSSSSSAAVTTTSAGSPVPTEPVTAGAGSLQTVQFAVAGVAGMVAVYLL